MQKAIVILITDFKIENLEELDYHSRWKIMENKQGKKIILTQKLEIDIIELPKIIGKELQAVHEGAATQLYERLSQYFAILERNKYIVFEE